MALRELRDDTDPADAGRELTELSRAARRARRHSSEVVDNEHCGREPEYASCAIEMIYSDASFAVSVTAVKIAW